MQRPYAVRFVDAQGNDINVVDSSGETAFTQYVPEPSTPQVLQTELTTITAGGKDGAGLEVLGTAFSRDALVALDGMPLGAGEDYQVITPERILILFPATLGPGTHTLQITNPPGDISNEVSLTVGAK